MSRRDGAALAISEQHRNAIGAAHAASQAWRAARQSVGLDLHQGALRFVAEQSERRAAVYLRYEVHTRARHAEHFGCAIQISSHVRRLVAGSDRKAQAAISADRYAAVAREECMAKACLPEQWAFQEFGVSRHGRSFMRPAGPAVQVSITESAPRRCPRSAAFASFRQGFARHPERLRSPPS